MEHIPTPEGEADLKRRHHAAASWGFDLHEHSGHDLPAAPLPAERHHGVHRSRCLRRIRGRGTGLTRPSLFAIRFQKPPRRSLSLRPFNDNIEEDNL